LFYLAQAHMLRGTFRAFTDRGMFGAARDAARSKSYAERYLKSHPEHGDAYLTIGLYNYYVGIAPTYLKFLRVLLLLPGGDRATGLRQLERAARTGDLFAPVAEGVLGAIYGSLEGRLLDGIAINERMVEKFPGNALLRLSLAQLYSLPTIEAYGRAEQQYRAILTAAASDSLQDRSDRHRATIGLAELRRTQWRIEEAIALLTPVIDQQPQKPEWVLPAFLLDRAGYRMLLNDAAAGEDAARVLADRRWSKFRDGARETRTQIAKWLARADDAAIYSSLLPANRLVVEDRWDEARAAYGRVSAQHPGDWQVRYRLAYLDFARGQYDDAAAALQPITSTSQRLPDWLRANAYLTLAWTHDIAGRRDAALTIYRRIVDDYGDESASGPARLGILAPYKRH
jgi:tetratricopeptide (TPR) repeat protein